MKQRERERSSASEVRFEMEVGLDRGLGGGRVGIMVLPFSSMMWPDHPRSPVVSPNTCRSIRSDHTRHTVIRSGLRVSAKVRVSEEVKSEVRDEVRAW